MLLSPALFLLLIGSVFVLALGLLVSISYLTKLISRLSSIEKENTTLKQNTQAKASDALAKAQEQIEEIVRNADKKAAGIISEAQMFNTDERSLLQNKLNDLAKIQTETLQKITNNLAKEYQTTLDTSKQDTIKVFTSVTKSFTDEASNEIADFRSILEKQTVGSQKVVEQKIEEAYKKIEEEIENYRQEKRKQVDQEVSSRMEKIARAVLGNSLSLELHEQLIKEALEEVHKQQ